jgi:hypothetical protein
MGVFDVNHKVNLDVELKLLELEIFLLHVSRNELIKCTKELIFVSFVEILLDKHQKILRRKSIVFSLASS